MRLLFLDSSISCIARAHQQALLAALECLLPSTEIEVKMAMLVAFEIGRCLTATSLLTFLGHKEENLCC